MGTINKLTKLVLSFLLVITCINFSIVQAEDGSDENYSEPTAVETISEEPASEPEQEVIPEEPVAEEPVIEEAAPVEEEKQEEVTPEVMEEAKVEEENNTPEIKAEPATQEETVEPEVQQEAPVEPEVQKVETVEEVKVTVVVSYVDENDHPLTDPITGSYPIEYRLDENVDAFKSFDGYAFEKVIVNDDAKNTISKDDVQKNGFRITKDMTSLKLVYQKMNLESESKEVIPEVTEEAVEEAEPESNTNETELSAFDQTAFAGKVGVHASAAEGVLPKGARLIVEQVNRKAILNAVEKTVSDNNKEMDSAVALDISIVDKDGVEIQPNGVVNITFVNTGVSGDEVKIYHVEDDASAVTEIANNTDSFDASHFSIYVITGENEVPLTTFNFVDVNGQTVSTQIVKTGDTLITPTAPDVAGKAFVEWQENGSKFDGFGEQTITKTETRTITAKYEDALYVYFYNPDGTQIMRTEKVADHNGHDYSHVSYDVNATHKLVGWAADQNDTTNIANSIAVPEGSTSVNVYAIIKEGYWVTFDSDGGSAIDSQFVFDKISLNDQTTPTKPGYTFDGWYNGSAKVENGATVTSSMTLTAHWKAAQVNYTINYWQQKVTDDKNATDAQKTYEYVSAETKKATTGTKISASNTKSYNGFTYNANNSSKDVEIAGDGTTIINVYYDRVLCTVNFYEVASSGLTKVKTATGLYEASLPKDTWDTSTYAWYSSYYTMWGSYGVNGSGCILLTSFDFKTAGYENNTDNKKSNGIVTECNFYGTKARREYEVRYYNQQADGSYKLVQTVNTSGGTLTVHEKFTGYDLYKLVKGNVNGESSGYWDRNGSSVKDGDEYGYNGSRIINIASKLKTYSLFYYNYNKVTKTVSNIKYTTPMNSYENYTPERPRELPSYYVFGGWYKDKACTTKFDFSKETMPNANLQIYAKWSAEQISLTYNLKNPEGTVAKDTKKVEAGTVASTVLPIIPTINEYSFAGWYYADGNGNITSGVFHTGSTITRDTSIVGKWLYKGELRVVYDPGTEKDVTVPTDDRVYAGGARVTVAGNATTTSGKKFLGWQLNGNVYKPGQSFEVNKDIANKDNQIILTATWGNAETSTTLTYDPGKGIGKGRTVTVMNIEAVEIKAHGSLGFTAPVAEGKEYYFAGWATSMDDANNGKATYAAGQSVHVDVDGENVLYATWIEKTVITLVANSNTVTYNGQSQEVNGFQSLTIDGYIVSGLNAHAQGTNVGTYPTEITGTAHVEKDNEDVTNKVVVKTTPGQLTITKKSIVPDDSNGIVVDAPKGSKYDGEKHENEPVVTDTKTDKTLVKGTDYKLTYSEDVINVGTVTVTITGTGNYEGTVDTSYKITPRKVIMTSADGSKVYDGSALTKNKVTESEDGFVKDDGATYNVTGSQTDTGSSKNTFTYTLNEKTLEKNYVIETKEGTLEVTPVIDKVVVEIKGKTKTETYNGNTHEVEGYDVTNISNALYPEEAIHFDGTAKASRKEEGTSYMGLNATQFSNTSANFTNVTFRVTDGWLKVTPKSIDPEDEKTGIQVTKPSDTMYNGEEQKNKPTVEDTKTGATLVENVDYTLSYTAAVNAGTVEVTITGIGNYTGTVTRTYEITPKAYTVTTESANKVYDGTELTAGGKIEGIVDGEDVEFKVTGSQTNKGTSKNTYSLKWNGSAIETNYALASESIGDLKVTEQTIDPGEDPEKPNSNYDGVTVNNPSNEVYDGKEHKWSPTVADKEGNALVEGTDYEVAYSTEDFTNVTGTITVTITGIGNYTGTVVRTYAITPAEVTVTANNANKVYGENDPELKATVTGTLNNDTVDYTLTREPGEDVGTYAIHVTGDEDQGNYHVTYTAGEFEITKSGELILTAELTGESATKVYDGNPLAGGATSNVKEGTTITYSTDGGATWTTEVPSITNVGTLNITARAENPNYEPAETTYSLTVTHATAIVTAENKTKVYGTADPELTATVSGTLGNDTVAYTLAREAGENAGKYKITVTGEENQGNYKVTYTSGTFEITPKSIIPDGPETPEDKKTGIAVENPGDVKYDGKDHAEKPVIKDEKTGVTLEEGKDYEIVYPDDIKNAGEITATVVGKGDYEGSFEIKYNITKRDVTFTSATDSKQYDGNALTNGNIEITGDGFIEGEGAEYKVTGTQTQVGNSANEFEYTLNENTLASNYDITKVVGTLTVTAAPAPKTPEKPKPEVKKSVDTSDDNNIVFYGNAFFMAMITLAGIIVLRKKSS